MYLIIFDDIVSILHNDYAGCLDKKGTDNPSLYRSEIKRNIEQGKMSDDKFSEIVQEYLLDFKDHHMNFIYGNKSEDVGFKVRRYHDLLYVVSNEQENRVKPGYAITALDEKPVLDVVEIHKKQLMETDAERENWSSILPLYNSVQVRDEEGEFFTLALKKYEREPFQSEYSIREIADDTLFLRLTDFNNHIAITKLINESDPLLTAYKHLIIDVRVNKGGSDLAYFELLPYLFEGEEIDLNKLGEETMITNCTNRNVELRTSLMNSVLSSIEDITTRNQINSLIKALEDNKGNGFVEIDFVEEMKESFVLKTKPGPEKIILLTDVYCGSSGDSFVEVCKNSTKITVIGRPTLGLNDYANIAVMEWENKFELWYPTSKLSSVDKGQGMSGIGIKPDLYIPWSPKHIKEDLDLKKALELLVTI